MDLILATLAGILVFPICLGLFQIYVWKPINVTAHRKVAKLCGIVTLIISNTCSAFAFVLTEMLLNGNKRGVFVCKSRLETVFNFFIYTVLALISFRLLGGRLRNLCPSHILHAGAFANEDLPLPETTVVSKSHMMKLKALREKHGCHICGKRGNKIEKFISVLKSLLLRIPNEKIPKEDPLFMLTEYPQCKSCSRLEISKTLPTYSNDVLKNKCAIITHATRLRLFKLWVPFPILFQYGFLQNALQKISF
ncbi:uncharacterized protein LOC120333226 [Styela clava]